MRKVLKITLYVVAGMLLLLTAAILYLNSPWGQNFVRGRLEAYLHKKLGTEVHIGFLGYGFPKYVVVKDVLLLDRSRDTLLSAGLLKVDLNMLQLLHKKVNVQQVVLQGVHSHIYRNAPDTAFNFSYIIAAFASKPSPANAKAKDTTSSLQFSLDRVKLDDIHARYDDHTGGTGLDIDLTSLDLRMKQLDMDNMLFHVKDLSVNGLRTVFNEDTSYLPPTPKDTTKSRIKVVADNVNLQNITFNYNDDLDKFLFAMQLGGLQLQLNKYDRDYDLVDVNKLVVSNSSATLTIGKSTRPPAPVDTLVKIDTTEGWTVKGKEIDLSGLNFKMDNENDPRQPSGVDYSHLDIHDLALKVANLVYAGDVAGEIKHMAVKDKSGLDVRELKTVFHYDSKGFVLRDLLLQTPNTQLQNYLEFHYPSAAAVAKDTRKLQMKVNVVKSIVGLHDVALFAPYLRKQPLFRRYENGHMPLEAIATGTFDNLNITHLYTSGLENTQLDISGKIRGLPDVNKLSYDLRVGKFSSCRDDIYLFVPPDSLPASFRIPDRFGITGRVAGNMKDVSGNVIFMSTDGGAWANGNVVTSAGKGRERYDLTVKTEELNLGRMMRQDSLMGPVTADMKVKGQSFDVKTMNAATSGYISSAYVKGYRYHDISAEGNVVNQHAKLTADDKDPNIQMQVTAEADFTGKYPAVLVDAHIDSIDLQALKLHKTELRAGGRIHADIAELNPDYPKGSVAWRQVVIDADGKRYFMDSVYVLSQPDANTGQNLYADLGVLQGRMTGHTPLTKIPAIVQDHINRHYTTDISDSLKLNLAKLAQKKNSHPVKDTTIPADYDLFFTAHVADKPILNSLLSGLTSIDSIHLDGSLTPRNLVFNANTTEIVYNPYTIENARVQLRGSDSALTYKITADQVSEGNYALYYADAHGSLDKNVITTNISLADADKKERFALAASLEAVGDSQVLRLQPGLKLNYNVWDVTPSNKMVFAPKGFFVQDLGISYKEQSVRANSERQVPNAPLKLDVTAFSLSNLTDIVSKGDTLLATGILSGNVTIQQFSPLTKMTGDIQIQNLAIYGDTLGVLSAQVNNKTDDKLDTKITLNGYGNDVALSGYYYLGGNDGNTLNFEVAVNALSLHSFEGAALHQLRNSSGFIRGNLKVAGSLSAPDITGELRTDNLKTNVTVLNSDFRMPAEKIVFTPGKIEFNNFTVADSAGNKAQINGTVGITDLIDPDLDVEVRANNWRAIHSSAEENKQLHGDLVLNARLDIKGTVTVPKIDGGIHVLNGTKLTITNPESNPEVEDSRGIVVFVNMRDSSWGKALMPRKTDTGKHKRKLAAGTDISVNITVDKEAQFNIIIDEASGDFISLQGEAYFNTAVMPGGAMAVNGNYLLHSGAYQMNYNFIKRRFTIQDGSTITCSGDPLKNTMLDINATYLANTPAYDLISRQVTDQTQLNYYKQSLPFDIDLHMRGNMMQPSFAFDIVLPEDKVYPLSADQIELVEAKLSQVRQDTNELNKQVFAVLILGRFVADDPFASGAGQSLGFTAVQSVSTFIGEQLNRFASNLVKGVDLSVNLATTQDYTTGDMRQRTDLNVAASKRLLNDRLKLTVGNDFEVEGPQTNNTSQSNLVPSNLAADYLFSSDGRYTVRVYRQNYDEGVLEGYVTETGINFILSVDYDRFKTIFMRSNAKKKADKAAGK